jgi:hypothetical protein
MPVVVLLSWAEEVLSAGAAELESHLDGEETSPFL